MERASTGATIEPEPSLLLTVGSTTDVGGRTSNEDAVLVIDLPAVGDGESAIQAGTLAAVADGMGGHQKGEVASQLAIDTVVSIMLADPGADTALLLKRAYREANDKIYASGRSNGDEHMMGTTLVVAVVRGKYATIANIGDSRAYLIRAGRLNQITQDHSLVAEQVAQGSMSPGQAKESPHRNILTQALGHRARLDPKIPNIFEIMLLDEDRLLLCSDGFYDVVEDDDFVQLVLQRDPTEAVTSLVSLAKERGTTDNVTAIVMEARREVPLIIERERVPVGPSNLLVPALVVIGAILFIAIVLIALQVF